MAEEKPADEAEDGEETSNTPAEKGVEESPEECMGRHEELHREHRGRIDHHEEFLKSIGYRPPGEESPDSMRRRRRHD